MRSVISAMTIQELYTSGILEAFSTYTRLRKTPEGTRQEAQVVLLAFLASISRKNVSSATQLTSLLQRTLDEHQASPQVESCLTQFVHQYPPHQAGILLHQYLLALTKSDCSVSTIKNYRSDINQFFTFTEQTEIEKSITKTKVQAFARLEREHGRAHATIKRKLISLTQFVLWLERMGAFQVGSFKWLEDFTKSLPSSETDQVTPGNTTQAEKTRTLHTPHYRSAPKQTWHLPVRDTKDTSAPVLSTAGQAGKGQANQEYRNRLATGLAHLQSALSSQNKRSFVPYLNVALMVLVLIGLGFFGYRQFFTEPDSPLAYPNTLTRPNRTLSFQGRLTDTAQNPITSATDFRFKLYDSGPSTTGGTVLWDSTTCSVVPDQDGIFATGLGDDCGSEIGSDVFSENSNVWLEVEVEGETLDPRQSIKTVAYALNSETLQGYPASASAVENTVLVMNNSGEVVLGNSNPVLKATGDSFAIEAETLTLRTSSGSNGDIVLAPDGLGTVIAQSYLEAPGATLSATYAGGTSLVLRGGPSGTANIQEWQNSAGGVLSVVDESGNIGIGTSDPNQRLKLVNSGASDLELGLDNGTAQSIFEIQSNNVARLGTTSNHSFEFITNNTSRFKVMNSGNIGISTTSANNFGLEVAADVGPSADSAYDLGSDSLAWREVFADTFTQNGNVVCDASGNCGNTNLWANTQNVFHPRDEFAQVADLVIGGNSTASADFQVIGSGTNAGYVFGRRFTDLDNTNYYIDPAATLYSGIFNGSVGIGVTNPGQKLEVNGNIKIGYNNLIGSNDSYNYLRMDDGASTLTNAANVAMMIDANNNTTNGYFAVGKDSPSLGTGTELFRITEAGNVGIGSTDPQYKLDTAGTGRFTGQLNTDAGLINAGAFTTSGGTASLNASSNFATNINTGTSTGAVSIGGGAGTVAVDSTTWDISTAGVASGFTGITSSGTITFSGLTANRLVSTTTGGQLTTSITSANVAASITNETGSGLVVFNNAPTFSTGSVTFSGITTDITTGTNEHFVINPNGTGNVGIATTTPTSFKLQVAGNVGPNADSSYDLGSSSLAWREVFADAFTQNGYEVCDVSGNCSNSGLWQNTDNVFHPRDEWAEVADLVIGGDSTSSADFRVTGLGNGTTNLNGYTYGRRFIDIDSTNYYVEPGNTTTSGAFAGPVGIGTTNPTAQNADARLSIYDTDYSRLYLRATDPATDVEAIFDARGNGTNTVQLGSISSHPLSFYTGGSRRALFDTSGNLRMNTSMSDLAAASGNIDIEDSDATIVLDALGTPSGRMGIQFWEGSAAMSLSYDGSGSGDANALNIRDEVNSLDRFTVQLGGNVGVGSTQPNYLFEAVRSNNGLTRMRLANENTGTSAYADIIASSYGNNAYIRSYGDNHSSSANTAEFGTTASGTDLTFVTNSSERMRISSTGNVGIGITNPDVKLHLKGGSIKVEDNDSDSRLSLIPDSGGTHIIGSYGTAVLPIEIKTNGNNGQIYLSTGGNVGIGTTNPSTFKLQVAGHVGPSADSTYDLGSGSIAWREVFADTFTQNGNEVCDSSGNCTSSGLWQNTNNVFHPRDEWAEVADLAVGGTSTASADILLKSNGSAYFSGNVGIGSTSPQAKLDVTGTNTYGSDSTISSASLNYGTRLHSVLTATPANSFYTTNLSTVLFNPSSNPGAKSINSGLFIAETPSANSVNMPSTALNALTFSSEHNGTGSLSSISGLIGYARNNSTATVASMYGVSSSVLSSGGTITDAYGSRVSVFNSGTMTNTYGVYVGDITSGTQTNTPYSFYAEDTGAFNYFAGNVGVGTTNPAAKLEVAGGNSTANIRLSSNVDTYIDIRADEDNNSAHDSVVRYYEGTTGRYSMGYDASANIFSIDSGTSLDNSNFLTVNSGGNVGIGTTQPNAPLQVNRTVPAGSNNAVVNIAGTITDGTTYQAGLQVSTNIAPSTSSTSTYQGIKSFLTSTSTNLTSSSNLIGTDTGNYITASSGTIGNLTGLRAVNTITSGVTINNSYGVRVGNAIDSGGGSITNNYGLYIEDQTTGTSTNYSIYSAGGTNYLAGNVGIGVTNPSAKIQVAGDAYFNLGEGFHILDDANYYGSNLDARIIRMIDGNGSSGNVDGGITFERYTSSDTTADDVLTLRGTGNVGVGITNPSYKLDIDGDARIASGSDLYIGSIGLNDVGSSNTTSGASLVGTYDEFTYSNGLNVQDVLDDLDQQIASIVSGSAGAWTDAGTYLHPTNGEVLGNSASAGSNKIAGLYLADSSPLVFGTDNDVTFNFSGSTLAVTQGNQDVNFDSNTLFIDGSANSVGIGTNSISSGHKLDVNGNIYASGGGVYTSNNFVFGNSTSGGEYFSRTGNDISVVAGGSNRFYVDGDAGNVGIGTTDPQGEFEIVGNNPTSLQLTYSTYPTYYTQFVQGYAENGFRLNVGGTNIIKTYGYNDADAVSFGVLGYEDALHIDTNGSVGIGLTNPSEKLVVDGNITNSGYHVRSDQFRSLTDGSATNAAFTRNSDQNTGVYFPAADTLGFTTAGSEAVRINSNGNVGINNTNPSEKLHVGGDIYVAGAGGTIGGSDVTAGNIRIGTNFGIDSNELYFSGLSGAIGVIGAYDLNFIVNNNTALHMNSAGYVRVGGGSPSTIGGVGDLYTQDDIEVGDDLYVSDVVFATGGINVGGTSDPGTGAMTVNNVPLDFSFDYDSPIYFAPQAYFEAESPQKPANNWGWNIDGFTEVNDTTVPFSKVALSSSYDQLYSDYIPVQPGETLYGEMWAMRETGASGTAGLLYYGIERYDKDLNPISTNNGTTYFVASAETVSTNSTWNKYSGTTTLPTSHTPYNGSDGGPVRYVRVRVLINQSGGTIPTHWGGVLLRRQQLYRDAGDIATGGNLRIASGSDLFVGAIGLNDTGSSNTTSGASLVGTYDEFAYSNSSTVQDVLDDLDAQIASVIGGGIGVWTDVGNHLYPTNDEYIGNEASGTSSQKIAGLYLADSAPLVFGNDNDISYSFSGSVLGVTTGSNDINFDSDTLFIDGSANQIGIGTNSPSASLDIASGEVPIEFDNGGARITIHDGFGNFNIKTGVDQDNVIDDGTTGGTHFRMDSNGYAHLWIDETTTVGGTFSPNAGLTINGSEVNIAYGNFAVAGTPVITSSLVGQNFTQMNVDNLRLDGNTLSATNDSGVYIHDNASNGLFVEDGGNIGIGTTDALEKVHIDGDILLNSGGTNVLRFNNTNSVSSEADIFIYSQGVIAAETNLYQFAGSGNYMVFGIGGQNTSSATEYMRLDSTGSLGIGVTNPAQKLTIQGSSVAGTGAQTNISAFTGNGLRINGSATNAQDAITYQSGSNGGGAAIAFGRGSSWDTFMNFYTNSSSGSSGGSINNLAMTINSDGNIGIGDSTPNYTLDVVGTARIQAGGRLTLANVPVLEGDGQGGTRVYRNLANFESNSNTETGAIVIDTGIAPGNQMSIVTLKGYMYGTGAGHNVDIDVNSYFNSNGTSWSNRSFVNKGDYEFSQVRIGTNGSGNVVIVLGDVADVHSYPKLWVEKWLSSHSSGGDDEADNWSVSTVSSLTGYNLVSVSETTYQLADSRYVNVTGDTMTGGLTVPTNGLTIGSIGLHATGASNSTSGASRVGTYDEFTYSNSSTVQDVLDDLDYQISTLTGANVWTDAGSYVYPTNGEAVQITSTGGATNPLYIAASTGSSSAYFREDSSNDIRLQMDDASGTSRIWLDTRTSAGSYFNAGNFSIGTSSYSSNKLRVESNENAESFYFYQANGTTGERDVFTIEDADTGGGGQDESSTLKVLRSGAFSAGDDGSSLLELTYTGGTADPDEQFYMLGRTTDEGSVNWGISITDSDFWTTGSIRGGATGTGCGATDAACFNSPSFAFEASGNSYINGGNLGIGSTSPGSELDIASSQPNLRLTNTNTGSNNAEDIYSSLDFYSLDSDHPALPGRQAYIQAVHTRAGTGHTFADAGLTFGVTNTSSLFEAMRITSDGSVGIGSTNPGTTFDVVGTAKISSGGSGGPVSFSTPGGASGMSMINTNRADIRFDNSVLSLLADAGTSSPAATSGLTINTNGSVGIGVGNASSALEVDGVINFTNTSGNLISHTAQASYDKIRVWNSSSYTIGMNSSQSYGYLNDYAMTFTMNAQANRGFLWRDTSDAASDGAMSLTTDGRLTVKSTSNFQGSVGIGNIYSPSTYLDVNGTGSGTNSLQLRSGNGAFAFDSNQILLAYNGTDTYRHAIKSRANGSADAGNSIDFFVWDQGTDLTSTIGTKHVMSLNGGNVGIGTTDPDATFKVNTGSSYLQLKVTGDTLTLADAGSANKLPYIEWRESDGGTRAMYQGWGNTSGTKWIDMRLENSYTLAINGGNVGIGTTNSSNATLHVTDSDNSGPAILGTYSGSRTTPIFQATHNGTSVNPVTYDFYAWDSTWGPVNGGIRGEGVSGWGSALWSLQALTFHSSGFSNGSPEMIIATSGNVGIGTSTPTAGKLQVDFTDTAAANSGSDTAGNGLYITADDTSVLASGTDSVRGINVSVTRTGTYGGSSAHSAIGVKATATAGSGASAYGYGGYFEANGGGIGSWGVYGSASSGAATNYGVYGATSGAGGSSYGLYGAATGASTLNYGVYTTVSGGSSNYAAAFLGGNVGVGTGTPTSNLDVAGRIELNLTTNGTYALCHTTNGAQSNAIIYDCSGTPSADYMEMYPMETEVTTGDLVAIGNRSIITHDGDSIPVLTKTTQPYQKTAIGVASNKDNAGDFNSIGYNIDESDNPYPVALKGRVPVKVTTSNGNIQPGDYITTSAKAGVGMKSTRSGWVVGKALTGYSNTNQNTVGTVMVFVESHWYDPAMNFSTEGELVINGSNGTYTVTPVGDSSPLTTISAAATGIFAKIKAGLVTTQELVVQNSAQIASLSVNQMSVAGQSLDAYVKNIVWRELNTAGSAQVASDSAQFVATGSAQLDNLLVETATVSGKLAAVDFSAQKTQLGSLLAENATISGTLVAENLEVAGSTRLSMLEAQQAQLDIVRANTAELLDATVSGTLYANNINGLEDQIAQTLQKPNFLDVLLRNDEPEPVNDNPIDIYTVVESAGYEINPDLMASVGATLAFTDGDVMLNGQAAYVQKYLQVNGLAYVADSLGVGNSLFVGNSTQISDGVIAYTPTAENDTLRIQPSGQGKLEFLAGLMTLEDGQVTVTGNFYVAGTTQTDTLLTNLVQPADFGNPFQVQVAGVSSSSGQLEKSRFEIINELGTPVATISAEGKAAFAGGIGVGSESISSPDVASGSAATVTASKTSGKAVLKAGSPELIIENEQITAESLIYVTPVGSTQNQVLYVKSQTAEDAGTSEKEGKFTVGFDQAISSDVSFNWWIVN